LVCSRTDPFVPEMVLRFDCSSDALLTIGVLVLGSYSSRNSWASLLGRCSMIPQALMVTEEGLALYETWQIPTVSFGLEEAVGLEGEMYVTRKRKKAYMLNCGHLITSPSQIGHACSYCEDIALSLGLEHAAWICLQCKDCTIYCSAAFCPTSALCRQHAGQDANNKWLCLPHFDESSDQLTLRDLEQNHGKIAAALVGFHKSLIFGDKRMLQ